MQKHSAFSLCIDGFKIQLFIECRERKANSESHCDNNYVQWTMYVVKVHTVNMSKWIHIFLICYGGDLVKLFGFAVCRMQQKEKEKEAGKRENAISNCWTIYQMGKYAQQFSATMKIISGFFPAMQFQT